jgi:hypothetical protein
MRVQGNPPPRQHDMQLVCHEAHASAATVTPAAMVDSGPGRLEQRRLTASSALVGYRDWPGRAQGCHIERRVTRKKPGEPRHEVVSEVTSLRLDQAEPDRLLGWIRQPWPIENHVHGVRHVMFDAERSQVRCGRLPQVMAAFRNPVIGLMPWTGETNRAAACRRCAAQPWSALALLGIKPDN